ncbi:YgaP-like transmembrane domain [Flavobacterium tegetincola]|uniref:YgaP-like transmembrane domain n=1 Tax=Flavobacterium tegetincola TaxID=150172 RepID=UPI000428AD10|nr:YgaP-like transmembrane domain [Flavobacterium tegetincola]
MNTSNDTNQKIKKDKNLSGTDPNRYDSSHTVKEAQMLSEVNPSNSCTTIFGREANVSKLERMLMVVAGGYLLYNGLSGKKKNIAQSIAGTTMLARGFSGYCPIYDAAERIQHHKIKNINIRTSVHVNKSINEVYNFWRELENLPKFMSHLESVVQKTPSISNWIAKGPAGIGTIQWNAEIINEETNKVISWRSLSESTINNAGKVLFAENANGGSDLDINISYHAPLGVVGEATAKFLNPLFEKMVKNDIENLKTFLEKP